MHSSIHLRERACAHPNERTIETIEWIRHRGVCVCAHSAKKFETHTDAENVLNFLSNKFQLIQTTVKLICSCELWEKINLFHREIECARVVDNKNYCLSRLPKCFGGATPWLPYSPVDATRAHTPSPHSHADWRADARSRTMHPANGMWKNSRFARDVFFSFFLLFSILFSRRQTRCTSLPFLNRWTGRAFLCAI